MSGFSESHQQSDRRQRPLIFHLKATNIKKRDNVSRTTITINNSSVLSIARSIRLIWRLSGQGTYPGKNLPFFSAACSVL
jgi:hypothetical protein